MAIVKRLVKGSALTHAELDNNFTELEAGTVGPVSAFASLPAAVDNAGKTYRVSDIGRPGAGSMWISDGVRWVPLNGYCMLLHSGMPFVMPASGSFGNNGALTLNVALDRVYSRCFMYFPTGAIFSGSAAGWYWTVMSSATVGVVYNNTYVSGWPTIPTIAGFTVTGPGAFTAAAGIDLVAAAITLPGNTLGLWGGLQTRLTMTAGGAGSTRTGKVFIGNASGNVIGVTTIPAANNFANAIGGGAMDGNNVVFKTTFGEQTAGVSNGITYSPIIHSVDMTVDKTISTTIKTSAAATDWIVLQEVEMMVVGG